MQKLLRGLCIFTGLLLFAATAAAQSANFQDGFEDSDFSHNPSWKGDTSQYAIIQKTIDGQPNYLLQLHGDSTNGGVSYLSAPSTNVVGYWEFYINLDFSPSGGNFANIFLMSNISDLTGSVNGYAVQAGEGGSNDVFRIVRFDNGSKAKIVLSDTTDTHSGGKFRVKVTRKSGGIWSIKVGKGYSGQVFQALGTAIDNTYNSASYFGVVSTYTSSRAHKFTYDFKIKLPPFSISQVSASGNIIDVTFNQPLDQNTVQPGDFSVDHGIGGPASLDFHSPKIIRLNYNKALPSHKYNLTVKNISDQQGTQIADTTISFTVFGSYAKGDVIINEFMYDPPSGQDEYVELKNTSTKYLNLQNWEIDDNTASHTAVISDDPLVLQPNSFLVLSKDTTALYNTYGPRQYLQTSVPALNNIGDDIKIFTKNNDLVDSLSYTADWGGRKVSLERRSDAAPSIKENFGDSPDSSGGTPGLPNEVVSDTTPPSLTNLIINGEQTLTLAFSEQLDHRRATDPRNYVLNPGLSVSKVQQIAADTVQLQLSGPMTNGSTYQLTVKRQQDIFGNTASPIDTSFTYYKISRPAKGNIFINEFMYDPPEGASEYVELYNPTSKSFNLQGWTINNRGGDRQSITDQKVIIPPDSFVVLAADRMLLDDYPNINLVDLGSHWATLRNHGDAIVVRDSAGTLLDSLSYSPNWTGSGQALERRSTQAPAVKANFGEDPNGFGSPGSANKVPQDTTPPKLTQMKILNSSTIRLVFSEPLSGSTATDASNYTIKPAEQIHLIAAVQDTVTLYLSGNLQSGQHYTVIVQNLEDIFGNAISDPVFQHATYIKYSGAQRGDVVINEIMHSSEPQFVELYNPTKHNFDLSGWTINDDRTAATIGAGTNILSRGYLVITDCKSFASKLDHAIYLSGLPHFNVHSNDVYIQDENGRVIDSLYYTPAFGGTANGKSTERIDPEAASNDPANFAASTAASGSTPGAKNSIYKLDHTPPTLKSARIISGSNIEARFNEFIKLTKGTRFSINNQNLTVLHFDPHNANTITLKNPGSLPTNSKLMLKAGNITDVKGNKAQVLTIPVARPAQKGNVVINEIMYDPVKDADDNLPDQSEYIELRNTAKYAVSLEGISLHDAPDENGHVRTINFVTTQAKYIRPGKTALIYSDTSRSFDKSRVAVFFHLSGKSQNALLQADRTTLSLKSTSDAVYLAAKNGATIDSVYYDKSWQNPNLASTKGISLERINPDGPGNNPSNWGSSTAKLGGTPGRENSLYQTPVQNKHQKIGISLSPNPFSPDGDGHGDRLFINYKLDDSNYLITVDIYDRYGRKVRTLANDKPAGLHGSLIWDGLKDNGSRNRIGIYIVIFKAHDSANGHKKVFKKTVVLARRLH
jgi:hypothetical protein